jgi:hypothetical protein
MKKFLLITLSLVCLNLAHTQTRSQVVLKWAAGTKELNKIITDGDTIANYFFTFSNARYQQIVDYKSIIIGDQNKLKEFIYFLDSLLNKVTVAKGETINYSIGNVKNISLSLLMGKKLITLWDNDMLGYCYLGIADIKKFKTTIIDK